MSEAGAGCRVPAAGASFEESTAPHISHASSKGVGCWWRVWDSRFPKVLTHTQTHSYIHTPTHTQILTHFYPLLTTRPVSPQLTHRHPYIHKDTHRPPPPQTPQTHSHTFIHQPCPDTHALAHCILQVRNGKLQVWGLGFGRHLGSMSRHCRTRHQPTQKQRSQTPPPPSSQGRKLLSIKGPNL